jgi:peroxiredoxin
MALGAGLLMSATASAQAPNAAPPPPPSVKVGQAAPDFTSNYLSMENGRPGFKSVKLSDFRPEECVLAFFLAAFSPDARMRWLIYQETSGQFNVNNTVISA